jgi:NIMA-interacting peptidyl-prolyl cis-trans isomerase 1
LLYGVEEYPLTLKKQAESGLPEGWEIRISNSKNLPYYFNPDTKESRWEPPEGADTNKLKEHMAQFHTSAGINRTSNGNQGKIRAAHLLVKHKDSRRASSWKENKITRTKEEAREIIQAHEQRISSGEAQLSDLASTESDCSSARKGGDL